MLCLKFVTYEFCKHTVNLEILNFDSEPSMGFRRYGIPPEFLPPYFRTPVGNGIKFRGVPRSELRNSLLFWSGTLTST